MAYITDEQRRDALIEASHLYDRLLNWRDERTILRLEEDTRPAIALKLEALRAAAFQLLEAMNPKPVRPSQSTEADDFDDIPF